MTRIELLRFHAELLQRLQSAGLKLDDWRYVPLMNDYADMQSRGVKRTAIVTAIANHYKLSERQVYNIIGRLSSIVD